MRGSLLLAAGLAAAFAAEAREPLTVGGLTARPGETVSGYLAVPDGVDPGTRIPVTLVHGARPGPVLALIAGTHGYEYTSILALPRLRERLDSARLSGSVILVHMANPTTFYGRRIYYSPDGKNLNRVYPGRADGTISERIAHMITTEVIARATHLVDMHCGDGNESLRPYSYWQVTGDAALDEAGRQMALAFGLDHIVVDRERPADSARTLYTSNTAVRRGKPAITVESGGMGLTDEASVRAQEAGALSVMAHLGIVEAPLGAGRQATLDRARTGHHVARHRSLASLRRQDAERGEGNAARVDHGRLRRTHRRGPRPLRRRGALCRRHSPRQRGRAARVRGPGHRERTRALMTHRAKVAEPLSSVGMTLGTLDTNGGRAGRRHDARGLAVRLVDRNGCGPQKAVRE